MRHQDLREGMHVALTPAARDRYDGRDNVGATIPVIACVHRIYCHAGYREPWIELANVAGQFRAKDLRRVTP